MRIIFNLLRHIVLAAILLAASAAKPQEPPNKALWDLFSAGHYQDALDQATGRIADGADDREVLHLAGRCLMALDRPVEARPYFEKAIGGAEHDWIYSWSKLYLGAIDFREGNDEATVQAWTEVRDEAVTENVASAAKRNLRAFALDEAFADWRRTSTTHCRFAFSPQYADNDLDTFSEEHERAYQELTEFFGGEPDMPLRYIVWGSLAEADSLCGIKTLGFANPQYCTVYCTFDQTVGHEMTHVICFQAVHPVARTRFINEGIAVCFDLSDRDRRGLARQAVQDAHLTGLNLPDLWQAGNEQLPDSLEAVLYPVAGAWIQMLRDKGGRDKLLALCRDQTLEGARRVYGDDLDRWMVDFSADLLGDR